MKKFGVKFTVTALSSLMSVGLVGSIAGTVAWYQFNTRVTASFIGASVTSSGVLQISNNANSGFTRDLTTNDLLPGRPNITPVTFGEIDGLAAQLPTAYKDPMADLNMDAANPGSYADVYKEAVANQDYVQYSVYLRALKNTNTGEKQVELPVYISDLLVDNGAGANVELEKGLRILISVDEDNDGDNERSILLSKVERVDMPLSGVLDLDGDGLADIKGGYELNDGRSNIVIYGNDGDVQNTTAWSDIVNPRVQGQLAEEEAKVLLTTPATGASKVTVTLWFEGWDTTIDGKVIDTREAVYSLDKSVEYPQNLAEGMFFVEDNQGYVRANQGYAEVGTHYFVRELADVSGLEEGVSDVSNLFVLENEEYVAATGTFDSTEVYFTADYEEADESIYGSLVNGLYTKEGSVYTLIEDVAARAEVGTQYFKKVSEEAYDALNTSDATVYHEATDMSAYYVQGNEGFVHPEDPFTDGVNYFEDEAGQNPLDTSDASIFHEATDMSEFFVLDGGNYVAGADFEDGVAYYKYAGQRATVPVWNGQNLLSEQFRFGLTFDVGPDAFED